MNTPRPTTQTKEADLEAVKQQAWQGASPNKLSSTARIMIGLARSQHKIPSRVPDTDPTLISMVIIEKKANKWRSAKPSNIDRTLADINDKIIRIGSAGTRPALQLQNKYTQEVGMIKGDRDKIIEKQNELQRDVKSSLQNKDDILGQMAQTLAQGKEPDTKQLKKMESNFQALTQKSDKLAIEEEGFSGKLKALKNEVTQTAEAVSGPVERPSSTPE